MKTVTNFRNDGIDKDSRVLLKYALPSKLVPEHLRLCGPRASAGGVVVAVLAGSAMVFDGGTRSLNKGVKPAPTASICAIAVNHLTKGGARISGDCFLPGKSTF